MGVFSATMKTHIREYITDQFPELNLCVVHGCKPSIIKMIVGRRKDTYFVANCQSDDCGKISDTAENVVLAWNKWNPYGTTQLHLP
mgnify:CR=1 FL=1